MKIYCPQCHIGMEIKENKDQAITCKACGCMHGIQFQYTKEKGDK